ncbi:odorant receptor 13a-like [Leptopilina boulardi]|uniref:odorant receptor 13a-like n=1 Tax=Leptopilina boulardi TaxID=63433 RepID=UPI0021F68CB4|nr:odorant receptor 13a-like [Leptopilina boulardi]
MKHASRISLQILGVWPDPEKNEQLATFHFFSMAAYQFIGVILLQTIKLIITWGDVDAMSEILTCALLLVVCGLTKIIALWYYKKQLLEILSSIIQDWNNSKTKEELDILKRHGYFSKKISIIYIVMAMGASAARICQITYMNADFWFKNQLNATHYLSMEAYFPYDIEPSPIFEITFFVDYMAAFFGNLSNCGTDSLFFQIGFHFTAVFQILHLKLMNIVTEIKNEKIDFNARLRHIIEKHEEINRGLGLLQDIFSIMLLVQLMAHSVLFCMQGYKLILSIRLGESAYECKWFHLPPKKARNLIIIILRSRKPKELTAARFYVMNMEKFGNILKTSMGYLSLLLTLKKA